MRDEVQARLERALDNDFDSLLARVQPLALGPPVDWPIQYRVMEPDIAGVRRVSEQVAERVRANSHSRIVTFDWNERSKSIQIQIDQDKARLLGLTSEQVSQSLNSALSGRTVTQLRDDIYLIDVIGRAQARDCGDIQSLRDLEINLPNGRFGAAGADRDVRLRARRIHHLAA